MQTTDKRNPITPDGRMAEEDQCWKQYWAERDAIAANAESDMEAAYQQREVEDAEAEDVETEDVETENAEIEDVEAENAEAENAEAEDGEEELGGEEFTPFDAKESRHVGFKKRDTDTSKKGRRKKILAARSGHHAKKAAIAMAKQLEADDPGPRLSFGEE